MTPATIEKPFTEFNPSAVEKMVITLVRLDNKAGHKNDIFEGILCYPFSLAEKKKFLVISHKQ